MKSDQHKISLFGLLGLLSFYMSACSSLVTEVSPENLPSLESRIVVSAFISPQDTLLIVRLGKSTPVFNAADPGLASGEVMGDNGQVKITNAQVMLSSDTKTVEFKYDAEHNWYAFKPRSSVMLIGAGKKYKLEVYHNNKKLESECVIPASSTDFGEIKMDTTRINSSFNRSFRLTTDISWKTPDTKDVYYRVRGYVDADVRDPEKPSMQKHLINSFGFDDQVLQKNESGEIRSFNAKGEVEYFANSFNAEDPKPLRFNKVLVELLTVDDNYYKYHESIRRNARDDDNPFVEPTQVYTNIKGGLGCFGASNRVQKIFRASDF